MAAPLPQVGFTDIAGPPPSLWTQENAKMLAVFTERKKSDLSGPRAQEAGLCNQMSQQVGSCRKLVEVQMKAFGKWLSQGNHDQPLSSAKVNVAYST